MTALARMPSFTSSTGSRFLEIGADACKAPHKNALIFIEAVPEMCSMHSHHFPGCDLNDASNFAESFLMSRKDISQRPCAPRADVRASPTVLCYDKNVVCLHSPRLTVNQGRRASRFTGTWNIPRVGWIIRAFALPRGVAPNLSCFATLSSSQSICVRP